MVARLLARKIQLQRTKTCQRCAVLDSYVLSYKAAIVEKHDYLQLYANRIKLKILFLLIILIQSMCITITHSALALFYVVNFAQFYEIGDFVLQLKNVVITRFRSNFT